MSYGSDRGRLPWMGPGMTYHEFRHQMKNPYFKAVFDKACQLEALIGEALRKLEAENRRLREALEGLLDVQNDAPLGIREEEWKQAVERARAALSQEEKP